MTETWHIEGDYAEACNCDVACQCIWMERPDDGACTVSIAWHVEDGQYGDVDLSGLNAALLARSDEGVMFDPDVAWDVVLVVDEAADDDQRAAFEDIYLGRAGGLWATIADTHYGRADAVTAPITFERDGEEIAVTVGDFVSMEVAGKPGFNGENATVSPHPLAKGMEPKIGQSTTASVSYDDDFTWDVAGNNSYFAEFEMANA